MIEISSTRISSLTGKDEVLTRDRGCAYIPRCMDKDAFLSLGIKTTRVSEKIFIIHGNNRSRSPFSNAVCVLDRRRVIMDTGCGLEIVRNLGHALGIDTVILSHSHPDHTGGTWLLQEIGQPEILVPCQGSGSIASSDKLALRFVGDDLAELWKETYLPITGFRDFTFTSEYGDLFEFTTGENRFIAMHAPGHLQDHYCLWEPDKKILLGFDIDLSPFGPWYGNPESDILLFKESIERIKRLPVETYISSHARPVKPPHFMKRLSAYESVIDERNTAILDAIPSARAVTIEEIVDKSPIYETDYVLQPDRIMKYGETQMIAKHLSQLVASGLVADEGPGRFRRLFPVS